MKQFFLLVCSCLCLSCMNKGPDHVLILGNSHIYTNNLPELIEEIYKSQGKEVFIKYAAKGYWTIDIISRSSKVHDLLKERVWDIVILQGHAFDLIDDDRYYGVYQEGLEAMDTLL